MDEWNPAIPLAECLRKMESNFILPSPCRLLSRAAAAGRLCAKIREALDEEKEIFFTHDSALKISSIR
jgi:hypothetical protein